MFNKTPTAGQRTPLSSSERESRFNSLNEGRPASTTPSASAVPTPAASADNQKSLASMLPAGQTTAPSLGEDTPVAGSRLIVGPNVKLKGADIHDCDTLVVEGRVEATMDSRVLRIAEQGAFSGKVSIDVAEIHGHFDGELTVRQQLVVHATGRVNGHIRYGKMLVEAGGELSGDIRSLSMEGVKIDAGNTSPATPRTELARVLTGASASQPPLNGTTG
ncbi:polymer-forming cytoskeletal protein [Chitinimonas sp.]|uniref:bactofilin family protein n=1 Tax=Chitinimonas sp. TaxID=1934313 RepID=UPI002F94AE59